MTIQISITYILKKHILIFFLYVLSRLLDLGNDFKHSWCFQCTRYPHPEVKWWHHSEWLEFKHSYHCTLLLLRNGVYCGPHCRDTKGESHYTHTHTMYHNLCHFVLANSILILQIFHDEIYYRREEVISHECTSYSTLAHPPKKALK